MHVRVHLSPDPRSPPDRPHPVPSNSKSLKRNEGKSRQGPQGKIRAYDSLWE